jgi:hypothetical protein
MSDELILDGGDRELASALLDAIDNASDQNEIIWLVESRLPGAKRIAAIVPVDVAEEHERQIAAVLATPMGTAEHAHWAGGRGEGHRAFVQLMGENARSSMARESTNGQAG